MRNDPPATESYEMVLIIGLLLFEPSVLCNDFPEDKRDDTDNDGCDQRWAERIHPKTFKNGASQQKYQCIYNE